MDTQKLKDANIPEKWWDNCYITTENMIFTPQFDTSGFLIKTGKQAYNDCTSCALENAKQEKLAEIHSACQNEIYAGIDVADSKGTEHFSLTIADQTNLSASVEAVMQGGETVPYHADGQLCRPFTASEIKAVYSAAKMFITKQTTLCNHLNVWIRRCKTVDEIKAITYESKLPDDLLANYKAILGTTNTTSSVTPN